MEADILLLKTSKVSKPLRFAKDSSGQPDGKTNEGFGLQTVPVLPARPKTANKTTKASG
ncbi:hypothetical protein [Flavobacterium sp.]|uniref:hypothetical protein n=1 Tax=Flavobacterium sp. TaxID=239 RepID=UPI0025C6B7C3|nr:hypothetical protein [Flavobacterium sp.]